MLPNLTHLVRDFQTSLILFRNQTSIHRMKDLYHVELSIISTGAWQDQNIVN